ncbi:MAG: hypothetical protein A2666_00490 [Parcubacteria group bacterium RIFCSPHIGHO2_01_FULL_47_10b]|nr:MAG: hypothetical protein A2666_00490 [Parcubacteria group bacterium RIFCSPHIGHO2_01_FULL_47_10b]
MKPVLKLRSGAVAAAVWNNKGKDGTFQSFTFERLYKKDDGKWSQTKSFNAADLLNLAALATRLHNDYRVSEKVPQEVELKADAAPAADDQS